MCERDAMKELLSIFARSIFIAPLLLTWPAGAQEHRFEDDPVTCFRSYSASWEIHAFCSPANASRCVPEIRSASRPRRRREGVAVGETREALGDGVHRFAVHAHAVADLGLSEYGDLHVLHLPLGPLADLRILPRVVVNRRLRR